MKENIVNKNDFIVRNGNPSDHTRIISIMKEWRGGCDLTNLLLKQFFYHFRDTIFIIEKENKLI